MSEVDLAELRMAIADGTVTPVVEPLRSDEIDLIAWSGSSAHLEDVAGQLERVTSGDVEYLTIRAHGLPVAKGGVDFAKEPGAATIWQVATHPQLEGLGLATKLMREFELRALRRGVRKLRLSVEIDNHRARRLYEHLGYGQLGESQQSWEAEASDGTRSIYSTTCAEMLREC